jgi:AraC-like DNA-binding protein
MPLFEWVLRFADSCQAHSPALVDRESRSSDAVETFVDTIPSVGTEIERRLLRYCLSEILYQADLVHSEPFLRLGTFFGLIQSLSDKEAFRRAMFVNREYSGSAKTATAVDLIRRNYMNPDLRLTNVADGARVSPGHLSHILRRDGHATFRQLLNSVRCDAASRLLITTQLSCKEISAACGFRYESDFSQHFRRRFGLTPGRYRLVNVTIASPWQKPVRSAK